MVAFTKKHLNTLTQIAIPTLTILSQIVVSLKYPEYGLIINLIAQPFWIYSGWKSYKQAGQLGFFITTVLSTIIITAGVINYWFIK